jgi:hypothetical protein
MKLLFGLLICLLPNFPLEAENNKYYDMAIEQRVLPINFLLTQENAKEIFKILVCEYFNRSFLEEVIVNEYKDYYIIRGSQSDREMGHRVMGNNSEIILIIKKTDGSIISFFMAR